MPLQIYEVKRGDTLWAIAKDYGASIPGNTTRAKVDNLVKQNNIKDEDKIYVGQELKLSTSGSSSSSTTQKTTTASKITVSAFGLKSNDTNGRTVIANWSKFDKSGTAGYTCRWTQYLNKKWVGSDTDIPHPEDMYCQSTFTADSEATKVRFRVRPYYKSNNAIKYWSDIDWSDIKEYDFSDNPPLVPPVPSIKIEDLTLTASIDNIKADELDATGVKFNIVKDNASSVHTSSEVKIVKAANYVSYQYTVKPGSEYKVRACSVNSKGKTSAWSDFSSNEGTKPSKPSKITKYQLKKRTDKTISAYLGWRLPFGLSITISPDAASLSIASQNSLSVFINASAPAK